MIKFIFLIFFLCIFCKLSSTKKQKIISQNKNIKDKCLMRLFEIKLGVRDEKVSFLVFFLMSQARRIQHYSLGDKFIVIQTFSY